MNLDDFKHLLSHLDIKAESKKPIEDPHDATLRRFKDKWLFVATLIAIAIVFGTCLLLKQDSQYTGIALNGVIALAMALAGYYTSRGHNLWFFDDVIFVPV